MKVACNFDNTNSILSSVVQENIAPLGLRSVGIVNKLNLNKKMNTLTKQEGVFYTQNIENLPIEERVFFSEGKGVNATSEHYRKATAEEIAAWEQHKKQRDGIDVI